MIYKKKGIIEDIYRLYDEIIHKYNFSCMKGCSSCCTRNVSVTSIEALIVSDALINSKDIKSYTDILKKTLDMPRFIPETTFNGLASIIMSGSEEPEEFIDPSWTPCPFLDEKSDSCLIYDSRPFHCRCMHSENKCKDSGYATMPAFIVTINNILLQYIEHIDKKGFVSNMTDASLWMMEPENNRSYSEGRIPEKLPSGFARCSPMPFLMVPPEHQENIKPILMKISELGQGI